MQGTRQEMRAGWLEVRWLVYFALLLPLVLVPVAAIAYLVTPPPPLAAAFSGFLVAVAVLGALILAGLFDGPEGRLGPIVWGITLGLAAIWLIERLARRAKKRVAERGTPLDHGVGLTMRVSFGGHAFVLTMELTADALNMDLWRRERLRRVKQSIIDQINQPATGGGERAVLIHA